MERKEIYAPSINSTNAPEEEYLRFEFSEETNLYHWHGDINYAGYTAEELYARL